MERSTNAMYKNISMLLIDGLATYRLSQLVAYDAGPFELIERVRHAIARQASVEQKRFPSRVGIWQNAAALIHCPYCLGVWFAGLMLMLRHKHFSVLKTILAIAGIQSLLQEVSNERV